MATVGQLIDRTFREYLWPADDRPLTFTLGANLAQAATSLTYDDDQLTAEEEEAFAPGALVDIWDGDVGGEQILLGGNLDTTANTVDVEVRGANGTSDAAHTTGDLAYINPTFTRRAVFDAVCDNVVDLWPELWQITTAALTLPARTSADRLAEAPAAMEEPVRFRWTSGSRWRQASVQAYFDLPTAEFTSGKAVDAPDAPASEAGYLTYKAAFDRPDAESDDLTVDFGIDAQWNRIIVIGTAAQLLAGREFEQVTAEWLTEQLEQQNYPPGSSTDVAFRLWRLHRDLLSRASQELRNSGGREPTVKVNKAVWGGV